MDKNIHIFGMCKIFEVVLSMIPPYTGISKNDRDTGRKVLHIIRCLRKESVLPDRRHVSVKIPHRKGGADEKTVMEENGNLCT